MRGKSLHGTIFDNRRFLWTASIAFAIAAILFPVVVLAAFGHFSQANKAAPQPVDLNTTTDEIELSPAPNPTAARPPSPNGWIDPRDVGITPPGVAVDADVGSPWSDVASSEPSVPASMMPSMEPSMAPSLVPSESPSFVPSVHPSRLPSSSPSSHAPSTSPTVAPTEPPVLITYRPGFLTVSDDGLLLSTGLQARIIARTGQFVPHVGGRQSSIRFHTRPDFGATFPDPNPLNKGGWIYTSNAEAKNNGAGGVGAITFNRNGNVIDYKMVLKGTTMNCGGGRTPWNTWVSCEEWGTRGQVFQVDPTGRRSAAKTVLGGSGGRFESFAFDVRNRKQPRFFVTEDHARGTLRRFTPSQPNWNNPWSLLHGNGTMEYLVLQPSSLSQGRGTYKWVTSISTGRNNAARYYPDSEGIDVSGNQMFFVCKKIKQLFTLNLDDFTYTNRTSRSGLFDGGPDQMARIVGNATNNILYFTEEGGRDAGIHGRNEAGNFYTILESPRYIDETTGLAFDPSAKHMYVAYQENGILFDITRRDGLPFYGTTLNVKYHNQGGG